MANGGYLIPPSENTTGSLIWEETWKRVDRFLPDLYGEIFPEASPPPASTLLEPIEKNPPLNEGHPVIPEKEAE
jgi:golgi-specific brefeldin A-resistance guanine nucleotide exchange factor 1